MATLPGTNTAATSTTTIIAGVNGNMSRRNAILIMIVVGVVVSVSVSVRGFEPNDGDVDGAVVTIAIRAFACR